MKNTSLLAPLLAFQCFAIAALGQGSRPIPPGVRQAEKADDRFEKNTVPPLEQRSRVDTAKLKRDADELASRSSP